MMKIREGSFMKLDVDNLSRSYDLSRGCYRDDSNFDFGALEVDFSTETRALCRTQVDSKKDSLACLLSLNEMSLGSAVALQPSELFFKSEGHG